MSRTDDPAQWGPLHAVAYWAAGVVAGCLGLLVLVGCAEESGDQNSGPAGSSQRTEGRDDVDTSGIEATRPTRRALPAPTDVDVPAIDLSEALVEVGYNADRTMEVPDYGQVGWFSGQPRPGQRGAAILAGHLDSTTGPDTFYRLNELTAGDEIELRLDDGAVLTYTVEAVESFEQRAFPHERVYGHTSQPSLRLITCDGAYDHERGGYESNLVVFATLADSTSNRSN